MITVRDRILEILDETDMTDRSEIAGKVIADMGLGDWLEELLPVFVAYVGGMMGADRREARRPPGEGSAPREMTNEDATSTGLPSSPSAWDVAATRVRERTRAEKILHGRRAVTPGETKLIGDLTTDDLDSIIDFHWVQIAGHSDSLKRFMAARDALATHGVETLKELPAQVIEEIFGE